jgi:hypothetical protein
MDTIEVTTCSDFEREFLLLFLAFILVIKYRFKRQFSVHCVAYAAAVKMLLNNRF